MFSCSSVPCSVLYPGCLNVFHLTTRPKSRFVGGTLWPWPSGSEKVKVAPARCRVHRALTSRDVLDFISAVGLCCAPLLPLPKLVRAADRWGRADRPTDREILTEEFFWVSVRRRDVQQTT